MKKVKFSLHNYEGGQVLSREELKTVVGGLVAGSGTGNCGVKINGEWREITSTVGSDANTTKELALQYMDNGWAEGWCCDHCPWNS